MNYTKFNIETWLRKEHYNTYEKTMNCGFSLTTKIDITNLKNNINSIGYNLYPSVIYLLARVVNTCKEFRFAKKMMSLFYGMKYTLVLLFSIKKLKLFLHYGANTHQK